MQPGNLPVRKLKRPDDWDSFVALFRRGEQPLPQDWAELFAPLRAGGVDDLMIVGQLGQSLDGRVATATGHSKYINCPAGIAHLHRLRALVDVVVVGVGTAIADNPQLTVREVSGPQPVRAVIDPCGRLPASARLFAEDGTRRLLITTEAAAVQTPAGVEIIRLPVQDGSIAPAAIAAALRQAGLRRILIEGGADTVSRFMVAGCLDRIHVSVAPILLGDGGPGLRLPARERADEAHRMPVRVHKIGDDVLFDCDLSAQRVAVGLATKSM